MSPVGSFARNDRQYRVATKNSGRRSKMFAADIICADPVDEREREVRDVLVLLGVSVHRLSPPSATLAGGYQHA